jgi:hypothetical protein
MLQVGGQLGEGEVVHLGGLAQVAVVVTGDVGGLRYAVLPAALGAYRPKPPGAEQLLLLVLPAWNRYASSSPTVRKPVVHGTYRAAAVHLLENGGVLTAHQRITRSLVGDPAGAIEPVFIGEITPGSKPE